MHNSGSIFLEKDASGWLLHLDEVPVVLGKRTPARESLAFLYIFAKTTVYRNNLQNLVVD
jgi:hypothetical protein